MTHIPGHTQVPGQDYKDILKRLQESQAKLGPEAIQIDQKSPQIEAMIGAYAPQMMGQMGTPVDTSQFAPTVASQNQMQQQAIQQMLAQQGLGTAQFGEQGQFTGISGTGTGIAGFQPFLNQAATDLGGASAAAAAGQGAGATGITNAQQAANLGQLAAMQGQDAGAQYMGPQAYQQFMSPYQTEVMDTTMAQYDQQMAEQQAQLGTAAGSAFGGGRYGVAQGELAAQGGLDRAMMQAGLLQQGYQQSQQAASQAFSQANQQAAQNVGLYGQAGQQQLAGAQAAQGQAGQNVALYGQTGQAQMGLAGLQPQLAGQGIGMMGQMGAQQQAQGQAMRDAQAQAAQMAAYEPQQRLGFFGQQLTGLMGGYPGGATFGPTPQIPQSTSMQNLMGIGSIAGNVGQMFFGDKGMFGN